MSAVGFGSFPVDFHDRSQARSLQRDGGWVTAQDAQVHVHYVSGRGGGYFDVDGVRVRLPGSAKQVELENVNSWSDIVIWDDTEEGWQDPTPVTTYEPPLEVRVQREPDGSVATAMAKDDYEYWTEDNSDPEFGLGLGVVSLTAAAACLFLNSIRLQRQTRRVRQLTARELRHAARRQGRIKATGKRGR